MACIADLVDAALRCKRKNGRYAYLAPFYTQAKDVAWVYLKDMVSPIPGVQVNESELRVDLPNGARVRLYGADNADRLRGLFLDGIVLDEYADMRPSVWGQVIRPALSDRQGWAVFIGTPKGHNEFFDKWEEASADPDEWFAMMLRASESRLLPDEELADARRRMTLEQYDQEYECSFEAAILGAYFGREMAIAEREGRICSVPYDSELPCYTAWDLGKGANMPVLIWQPTRAGPNVIDFVEGVHSDGVPQVLKKVEDLPYNIEAHYVPPDAKITEPGSGRTRIEQIILHAKAPPRLVTDYKIDDRISAAKLTLPVTRLDAVRCKPLIEALKQYKADFDEVLKVFRDIPLKNWASHPADAFQCLAGAWRSLEAPKPKPPPTPVLQVNAPSTATFNDVVGRIGERRREDERI